MNELSLLLTRHLDTFLPAFARLSGMLAWAPVLGHRSVPIPYRAALALTLALVLTPLLPGPRPAPASREMLGWALLLAGEALVGLAIASVAQIVMGAADVAGEVIGFQMGLSAAAVFDPSTGQHPGVVTRFEQILALLIFLAVNGHHLIIRAVASSFQRLTPGSVLEPAVTGGIAGLGGTVLQSGVALAAPLIGMLLVLNVALALVARATPQAHVFIIGLPVSVGLGLLGLLHTVPHVSEVMAGLIGGLPAILDRLFGGGIHGLR
ncbi:MAG TPA: flagellar biosynthetic protein FliR [Candidatus Bathyarchaeia archaeon]|nr:flagellar biosynthetic protein FliR [Candidatus Bathyarchaeia archaeon]